MTTTKTPEFTTKRVHIASITSRVCIELTGTNAGDHVVPTMERILDLADTHGWSVIPTTTRDRANALVAEALR